MQGDRWLTRAARAAYARPARASALPGWRLRVPAVSGDQITVGALRVRFLIEDDASGGSVTLFEGEVPAQCRMPAPHSHDGFEETIYGLEGVTTWTVEGEAIEIGPGEAVCIPRGSVHGFANHGAGEVKFLAVASPGVFGPAYFREIADVLNSDGPPDIAALAAVGRLLGPHAARRFVEQQQVRVGRESTPELEQLQGAVGQGTQPAVADVAETEQLQDRLRPLHQLLLPLPDNT